MSTSTQFDTYLQDNGPTALVIREPLMPVEGPDGVLFPSTFAEAKEKGFKGGYNIDGDSQGDNICIIDTVGSQANRIEPLFMTGDYVSLVPQITIKAGDHSISILEAGHRAGDAIVRCSVLKQEIHDAFTAILRGNAEPLARIAPTSLVFGVWDSRGTYAKVPRIVSSTIRARNVRELTRSAVYIPPIDYASLDVFTEEDKAKAEGDGKSPLATQGFVHVPASASHGGVIATGGVLRTATLGLAALRLLSAEDEQRTLVIRRYILGLSLVAFTAHACNYLRQGCMLVLNPDEQRAFEEVHPNGDRTPCDITHDQALAFATKAASEFGVGESRIVEFDKALAKADVTESGKGRKGKTAKSSK